MTELLSAIEAGIWSNVCRVKYAWWQAKVGTVCISFLRSAPPLVQAIEIDWVVIEGLNFLANLSVIT